jgi:hypothetical protein
MRQLFGLWPTGLNQHQEPNQKRGEEGSGVSRIAPIASDKTLDNFFPVDFGIPIVRNRNIE